MNSYVSAWVVLGLLHAAAFAQQPPATLVWRGCGVSKKAFMEACAEEYQKQTQVKIQLSGGGAQLGIETAAAGGADLSKTIGSLQPRRFVHRDVKEDGPSTFAVRWAMSFLRGPISRGELEKLPGLRPAPAAAPVAATGSASPAASTPAPASAPAPSSALVDDGTTAQPPAVAEATRAALQLIRTESWRRDRLTALIDRLRSACTAADVPLLATDTAIQPIVVGADADAVHMAEQLDHQGLLVPAIRPPSVAEGAARLRITLCAEHQDSHIDALVDALAAARRSVAHG